MGSNISHFDILLNNDDDNNKNDNGYEYGTGGGLGRGQHEFDPMLAGSLLRGTVRIEIKSPISYYDHHSNTTTTTTTTNNNNDPQRPSPPLSSAAAVAAVPVLQLRMYGKEKVKMNLQKAHCMVDTTNTKTGRIGSKVAEREFLNIPIHWNQFPIEMNPRQQQQQQQSKQSTKKHNQQRMVILPVGIYTFPFQIQLPIHLPSSIYHPSYSSNNNNYNHNHRSSLSQMNFRIQYKIKATLHLPTKGTITSIPSSNNSHNKPSYSTVRYVWVAAISDPTRNHIEPVPCMVEPIAMELTNLGLFGPKKSGGIFMFGALIDNTQLYIRDDEIVPLHVSCRNDSNVQIHKVQISIIEQLTWNTIPTQTIHEKTGIVTTSTAVRQVQHIPLLVMDNVQLPGLYKETKGFIKSVMETMFGGANTTKQNLHRQVYHDLISGQNLIPLTIPTTRMRMNQNRPFDTSYHTTNNNNNNMNHNHSTTIGSGGSRSTSSSNNMIRESYHGQLIQISHYVKIVFQTGTFCKTPTLEIPIQLLPNPITIPPPSSLSTLPPMERLSQSTTTTNNNNNIGTTSAGSATYQPTSKLPSTTTTTATSSNVSVNTGTTTITAINGESAVEVSTSSTTNTNLDHIPMASAVIVATNNNVTNSSNRYEANEAVADVIVLGGDAIVPSPPSRGLFNRRFSSSTSSRRARRQQPPPLEQQNASTTTPDTGIISKTISSNLSNIVPLSAPTKVIENSISVPRLLLSLRSSMMDHYEYIQSKICESEWIEVFQTMSTHEYGSIIANVHEFDQPRIALLLAPFINRNHGGCNCEYTAAAIRHTSTNHRAITAQKLIPLCIDIHTHHTIILEELNGWEQTITESTLTEAMKD